MYHIMELRPNLEADFYLIVFACDRSSIEVRFCRRTATHRVDDAYIGLESLSLCCYRYTVPMKEGLPLSIKAHKA